MFRPLLCISLIHLTSTCFATTINCPPVEMIKSTNFKYVMKPRDQDRWIFSADPINFEGIDWTIRFETILPRDTNPNNILQYGQKMFELYPVYFSHLNDSPHHVIYCDYSNDHAVYAYHVR